MEWTFELTDSAMDWLVREGFDAVFGARPLRRLVQKSVENPLSRMILARELVEGDHVVARANGSGLTFTGSGAEVEEEVLVRSLADSQTTPARTQPPFAPPPYLRHHYRRGAI